MGKHMVSFSGGKDSTAMLLGMLESGMQVDEIIFVVRNKGNRVWGLLLKYKSQKVSQNKQKEVKLKSFPANYVKIYARSNSVDISNWNSFRNCYW